MYDENENSSSTYIEEANFCERVFTMINRLVEHQNTLVDYSGNLQETIAQNRNTITEFENKLHEVEQS